MDVSCLNLTGVCGGGGTDSEKKGDSRCKISNETVAEIEILFKGKNLNIWSFFLYIIWMIWSERTIVLIVLSQKFKSMFNPLRNVFFFKSIHC